VLGRGQTGKGRGRREGKGKEQESERGKVLYRVVSLSSSFSVHLYVIYSTNEKIERERLGQGIKVRME